LLLARPATRESPPGFHLVKSHVVHVDETKIK
jgi:hypothetical protein